MSPKIFEAILRTVKICNNADHCWEILKKSNMTGTLLKKAEEIGSGTIFMPIPSISGHPALAMYHKKKDGSQTIALVCISPEFKDETVPFFMAYMKIILGENAERLEVQLADYVGESSPKSVKDMDLELRSVNPSNN